MRPTHRFTVLVFALCSLLSGCGESSDSAFGVVREAYMSANSGDYAKAQSYMSSEVRNGAPSADMKGPWDLVTRNRTIEKINDEGSDESASRAEVRIHIDYHDGRDSRETVFLIKENGAWKFK